MAGIHFGSNKTTTEKIFCMAKTMGVTKNGEIFSVEWLAELGNAAFPELSSTVRSFPAAVELVNVLQTGKLLLVAYDCDRNHEPTWKNGHKSHWALIVGFVVSSTNYRGIQSVEAIELAGEDIEQVYVLAMHGKSSLLNMWSYEELRRSNEQLKEAGPDRPDDDYVIPNGGIQLKDKCVYVSRK